MIYNTKNRFNNTTESQKEKKSVLTLIFSTVNKMWSLKSLAMLKCESRTNNV